MRVVKGENTFCFYVRVIANQVYKYSMTILTLFFFRIVQLLCPMMQSLHPIETSLAIRFARRSYFLEMRELFHIQFHCTRPVPLLHHLVKKDILVHHGCFEQ